MAPRQVELVSVSALKPSRWNVKTHSKKQIRQISNMILRVGWTNPPLVDEDDMLLTGHGRHEASKTLGFTRFADGDAFTNQHGFRRTTSIGATLTGLGGDLFIIDEPPPVVAKQVAYTFFAGPNGTAGQRKGFIPT